MMTLEEQESVKAERLALPTGKELDNGVSQTAGLQRANNPSSGESWSREECMLKIVFVLQA